ncbi:tetratricopeptide repeat protein [Candidatus Microgenomates bacterium]|nr:tetratricopeptide repeat protein [Candidatus Microgenomates bacterium]
MKIHQRYLFRLFQELKIALPIFFAIFLTINLFIGKTDFEKNKDTQNHEALAADLLKTNQIAEAEREARAVDSPLLSQIEKVKTQPEKIQEAILFWQKVTDQFPNYRDAYLKLAILSRQLNRTFDAQKFLNKALEIDPNSEVAKKLSSLL